ncbi:hypothetical protein GQ457_14G022510 [Hibiscus cannabinus]
MDASASVTADHITELDVEDQEPSVSTLLVNFDSKFEPYGAMTAPLYQTATFKQPSATENGPYDYTRSGNPRRDTLESCLYSYPIGSWQSLRGQIEHFALPAKKLLQAGDDIYGGPDRLLSRVTPKSGVLVKRVNTSDLDEVAAVIGPKTKLTTVLCHQYCHDRRNLEQDSLLLDFPRSFQVKRELILEGRLQLSAMQFRVNCLGQWNMDASASVTADYITGHFTELYVPCKHTKCGA